MELFRRLIGRTQIRSFESPSGRRAPTLKAFVDTVLWYHFFLLNARGFGIFVPYLYNC